MAGITVLAALFSITTPTVRKFQRYRRDGDLARRFDAMVLGLGARRPAAIKPTVWEESVTWTQIIGPTNLYSFGMTPFDSRERLAEALGERLKGPIGPDVIPWLWAEYAAMVRGRNHESYVRSYRGLAIVPILIDSLAVRPPGVAPNAWDLAVKKTEAAIDAIVMHPREAGTMSPEDLDRFLDSTAELLARPAEVGRLLAVWDRLAESSPAAKAYVERRFPSINRDLGVDGLGDEAR